MTSDGFFGMTGDDWLGLIGGAVIWRKSPLLPIGNGGLTGRKWGTQDGEEVGYVGMEGWEDSGVGDFVALAVDGVEELAGHVGEKGGFALRDAPFDGESKEIVESVVEGEGGIEILHRAIDFGGESTELGFAFFTGTAGPGKLAGFGVAAAEKFGAFLDEKLAAAAVRVMMLAAILGFRWFWWKES